MAAPRVSQQLVRLGKPIAAPPKPSNNMCTVGTDTAVYNVRVCKNKHMRYELLVLKEIKQDM